MSTKTKSWKAELVRLLAETPKSKDGKIQWNLIVDSLAKTHGEYPKKKLQDYTRTVEYKKAAAKYAAVVKAADDEKKESKKVKKATEAQPVSNDGSNEEPETNVIGTPDLIEEKRNADGSISKTVEVTLADASNLDENQIMKILGYDPIRFTLKSSSLRRSEWDGFYAGGDGGSESCRCTSVKLSASVVPVQLGIANMAMAEAALKASLEEKLLADAPEEIKPNGNKMVIVNVADLHFGKLAWAPECGKNYDYKIATRRFNKIVNDAITLIKKESDVERIVFFWCQDFFHYDSREDTTTAGTFQDSDIRWQKMFDYGTRLLIEAINKLAQLAPVTTMYVRSNHDTMTAYYATAVLGARFADNPNVTVDGGPSPRKYIRYGVNLFGFGHGDKEGKRMSSLMPVERAKDWGDTWNHEFFLGHYHSLRTYEENGVILRYMSSPTGTDAWHCESGFLGAQQAAQLFVRGKQEGILAEYTIYTD